MFNVVYQLFKPLLYFAGIKDVPIFTAKRTVVRLFRSLTESGYQHTRVRVMNGYRTVPVDGKANIVHRVEQSGYLHTYVVEVKIGERGTVLELLSTHGFSHPLSLRRVTTQVKTFIAQACNSSRVASPEVSVTTLLTSTNASS
ncbi:hypothetical protein CF95_gp060 [Erwinia phage PhiEaH1]|uniref:Uncharacterized protein n=1 Tax=Erwinia phage PhiEaH1 TaxID=1401669 RepID=W8CZD7_9CAUD|nr:hypothetical protein CF95_gp060 [Erwinia phage PhiEaH1]AGX01782.1 hypothetical protein [Erwinia phage PhiEaH1]